MVILLQSRVVDIFSAGGSTTRSTSYSLVQSLPTVVTAVRKGSYPQASVEKAHLGCGNAFWQDGCAAVATTPAVVSKFSTIYTTASLKHSTKSEHREREF
jgi:hypothetical protein